MWLDLPKPATYAHNGKEFVHCQSLIASSIKLTNYHNTIAKSWLHGLLFWGLFVWPVRHPLVLRCPLNATGQLVPAATFAENDVRSPWIYLHIVLCNILNVLGLFLAISLWKFLSFAVTCHFMPTHHPQPPPLHSYICLVLVVLIKTF